MSYSAAMKTAGCLILALLLLAPAASAQNAQINGTVRDISGSVVPGCKVIATNTATQVSRTVESNEVGLYVISNLQPGPYILTASKEGFQKAATETITLSVNQTATVDVPLAIGAVTDSVHVSAESALLEATSAQLGTVVTEEKIADLPLNGRNFTQLLMLSPGASPVSTAQNSGGAQVARVGLTMFPAMNGQSNRSNAFLLDGVYNNGHYQGTYAIAPSVDALSEFKVQAHSDQAEFGGVSGGIVNIATKSGTNSFHGSAYEFIRNDALDARDFFTAKKPTLRQNQFGGTLGGPVRKDKTFFFFSYEGYRWKSPSSSLSLVPTPAELSGDFRTSTRQIFNPYTTRVDPANATRYLRDPFPNNVIPASLVNPATRAFADAVIPKPIDTGIPGYNARNTMPQTAPSDQYSIRIDHHFSSRDFLWGRYTWGTQDTVTAQSLQNASNTLKRTSANGGVNYTHIFDGGTAWSTLFGYSTLQARELNYITSEKLIPSGVFKGMPSWEGLNAPSLGLSGFAGLSSRIGSEGPMKGYQLRSDFSKVIGSHTLKMGGEMVFEPWVRYIYEGGLGFNTLQTADLNNQGRTGYDVASFVLGTIDNRTYTAKDFAVSTQLWNGYFQDSWKVTPKLTINLGLRWDLLVPPTFTKSFPSTWDFVRTGKYLIGANTPPACKAGVAPPCLPNPDDPFIKNYVVFTGNARLNNTDWKKFGPRFSLAYRVSNNTVFRGSFSIFHDLQAGVSQMAQNGDGKWPNVNVLPAANLNRTTVDLLASDAFGGIDPRIPAATPATQTGYLFDPLFQAPYSEQWNLDIQHTVAGNLNLTVGYVGSHNVRLPIGGQYNTAMYPAAGALAPRQPFPYAPITDYDRSIGQGSYNGLHVKAEQRLARNVAFLVAYTWSKSIDVASSGQFGSENQSLQNPYDPNSSRSVSGFDIPQLLSTAVIYELPFGKGKAWLTTGPLSRILGNWQLNGLMMLRSGQPYSVFMNLDTANIGANAANTRTRPDLVGNPVISNPGPYGWFNTAAFATPAPYRFGTAGRNQMRTDPLQNFDLSLFREDRIREGWKIQLRAEMFNAFNHPTFGTPVNTFTNVRFGQVSSTVSRSRQIQLGLKFIF